MKTLTIEGQIRSDLGKKSATALRREDMVPCVLYGGEETLHFAAPAKAFRPLVFNPDFHKVELVLDGKSYEAIKKDVQFHPVKDHIVHMDFLQLVADQPVITELPVHIEGNSPGVREGGLLKLKVRNVTIKALPKDLVEHLPINVDKLKLGKSMRVGDIEMPGIEIMNSPGIPVVTCEIPRALRGKSAAEIAEDEAEAEAAAEKKEAHAAEQAAEHAAGD